MIRSGILAGILMYRLWVRTNIICWWIHDSNNYFINNADEEEPTQSLSVVKRDQSLSRYECHCLATHEHFVLYSKLQFVLLKKIIDSHTICFTPKNHWQSYSLFYLEKHWHDYYFLYVLTLLSSAHTHGWHSMGIFPLPPFEVLWPYTFLDKKKTCFICS